MASRTALRQLMAHAASAGSLDTVYRTALSAVQQTLRVERAALLVFDEGGRMRFVAASGLSEEYRTAVDGHSPWSADETQPTAVLVSDVERDPAVTAYLPILRRESIRALAFVPIQFGTRLLGKFMLYYREPHAFSDDEIAVAEQIADHVAFALEHHRIAVALESRIVVERALREQAERDAVRREGNERRLNAALAAGRMGAWDWDIKRGVVNWSSELESIHGLAPGTFERTLDAYKRDVHPADADRLTTAIAHALDAPDSGYDVEYRIIRPDGMVRWLAARGRVILDPNGQPSRMVGICRDVTEQKRAEEAAAFVANASRVLATTLEPETIVENLTRLVVPSLGDWCIVQVIDAEGRIHPVEIAHGDAAHASLMRELFRRWPSDPNRHGSAASVARSGKSVLIPHITDDMLADRVDDASFASAMREMRLHSSIAVPLQARGRTIGALTVMSAQSGRVYDEADLRFAEDIASWAAIAIDNAELYRQAEVARLAAENARAQLEALTKVSDQLAVSLDPEEALRHLAELAVPAFADCCITYGVGEHGIRPLGFAHRERSMVPLVESLANSMTANFDDQEGPGMVIRLGEPCVLTAVPPGDEFQPLEPCSIMIVPLNARGRTLGAIVLAATDDSGRRFDEADLKIAMELANRAALLVDNARLYAEARAAVRLRDEMVAFVSHDLRDPLQAISAATATLRLEPQSADNAESIESIARASTQMGRLVQDLLDVSIIEAGRLPLDREPVDLADLMRELQTLAAPQIKARRAHIELALAPGLPAVPMDRHRVLQVLLNLVGNALKFGAPGNRVTIGAERQDDAVRIWVQDSGAGIGAAQLARVFERFWRAGRDAGVGLGLAVAKGIVEAHGGRIGVTSQLTSGSTFFFTLPMQSTPDLAVVRERLPEEGRPPKSPRHGQRVLLVDDDQDVVRSLVRLVRSFGHDVHVAFSGEEALETAERFRPHVILMDIGLPGLSGYEIAREMRSRPWGRIVSLLAMTGWVREADRRRALEAGFDRHLTKPLDPDVLEGLLRGPLPASPDGSRVGRRQTTTPSSM